VNENAWIIRGGRRTGGTYIRTGTSITTTQRPDPSSTTPGQAQLSPWTEVATVFQCNLQGQRLIDLDLLHFGGKQKPKDPTHYRIEQHNINNLPENGNAFKSQTFVRRVATSDNDMTIVQEIRINWRKSKGRDKWHERVGSARVPSNFAHNTRELQDTDRLQPEGTALIAAPTLQSRCREKGQDPTGLGRWVWMRVQGTSDYNTLFFSAYRPCMPLGAGVNTVHAQHAGHLGATSKEPRTQLLLDLAEAIKARQEQGDYIILGMDFNQEVTSRPIRKFFRDLHLHNAILSRHPNSSPPATCHRNENIVQIDGIYCSIGIVPVTAGF
jgi:hypothetical protein